MKVIVFGGNGFVGKWLLQALSEKEMKILSCDLGDTSILADVPYKKVDIRRKEELEKIPITEDDIVVNLAANQYHGKVPRKGRKEYFFGTNTEGANNLLDWAYGHGCRKFIQYTTDMTYGKPQYLPVDTEHPQCPFGPYGESKVATERLCRSYREKGMNITIFRPRMIIGPGRMGILKKLFWLIRHNLPVPTIGSGRNCYQMVSVFDCVSATLCAIDLGVINGEYNLGSKDPPSTRELLKNLVQSVGSHSVVLPTPGKLVKLVLGAMGAVGIDLMYKEQYMIADESYILDVSKTERELGWEPKYADRDMIIAAFNEYLKETEKQ